MERKGHVKLPSFNELTSSFQQTDSRGDIIRVGDDNSNYTTTSHAKPSIFGVVQNVQDASSQHPLKSSIPASSDVPQSNIILQNPTIGTPNQSSPGYFTLLPVQPGQYHNIQYKQEHQQNYTSPYQNPYYPQMPQNFPYPGSFNEPNRPPYSQIQDPNILKLYQQQQQQQQQQQMQVPQYYTPYPQTSTPFQQTQLPAQQQSSYHSPVDNQIIHAPPPPPTASELQHFRQSPYGHQQQSEVIPSRNERLDEIRSQAQGSETWIQNTPFKFPNKAPLQTGEPSSYEDRVIVSDQEQEQEKHPPVKQTPRRHSIKKNPPKSIEISVPLHRRSKSLNLSTKTPANLKKTSQRTKPSGVKPLRRKLKEGSSSNVSTEKEGDEKKRFLEMFGDVINMLQDFGRFEELLSKFNQLGNFLNENDKMKHFINIEKERLKVNGEFFNNPYEIKEFYRFLREFPIEELIFLRDGFLNSYSLVDHWVKIVDSPERSFSKDKFKIEAEGVEDEPLSEDDLVDLKTDKIIKKAKRLSADHIEERLEVGGVPGELVSLQVDPLKPIEDTSSTKFAPRGFLHQDLSMKPKTVCMQCGSTSTPEWRKGPEDARTLCNACGLFHTKLVKKIGSRGAAEFMKKRREQGNRTNRRIAD